MAPSSLIRIRERKEREQKEKKEKTDEGPVPSLNDPPRDLSHSCVGEEAENRLPTIPIVSQ